MTSAIGEKFEPAVHMPAIAPAPAGTATTIAAYYADVQTKTAVAAIAVPVAAELLHPVSFPQPAAKALKITIPNPAARRDPSEPEFGTLFAAAGGNLSFVPAAEALPVGPLFSQPVKYTPTGMQSSQAGSLVLRVWPGDVYSLHRRMGGLNAPSLIYYLGVAKDSLDDFLPAAIERVHPQGATKALAFHLTKAGVSVSSQASWQDLRDAFLVAFKNGKVSLVVRGGTPVGRAAKSTTAVTSPGQMTLWVQNPDGNFGDAEQFTAFVAAAPRYKDHPLDPTANQLRIWIAAFIPQTIASLTISVPNSSSKTMIPGPIFSGCFLTDQRTFSATPEAKSRMRLVADIDIATMKILRSTGTCDQTGEIDCGDAKSLCKKIGDASSLKVTSITKTGTQCKFTITGGASNPCASGSPEINWDVTVLVKRMSATSASVEVQTGSMVEPFPAFEMYASWQGSTKILFTRSPNAGATPWNLFGNANQPVTGLVSLP